MVDGLLLARVLQLLAARDGDRHGRPASTSNSAAVKTSDGAMFRFSYPLSVLLSARHLIPAFCMSPCSSDYIFTLPRVSGARGWVIVSSPPSRYTFHNPLVEPSNDTFVAWLGIASNAIMLRTEGSTEFTRFFMEA